MKILHVTLGNPKHHRGGLNKYCVDLMDEQEKEGHRISVLYPGVYGNNTRIKKSGKNEFSIEGALPVAIIYGIDNPDRYMKKTNQYIYTKWLNENKPDVIHVHSLMGIHEEFFSAAGELNIPMIFTTHDYYSCCFRCNLFDKNEKLCIGEFDALKCQRCNIGAGLNKFSQMLLQVEWYQVIKNLRVIQFIKNKKLSEVKENAEKEVISESEYDVEKFENLFGYYYRIMKKMTVVHCNSDVAMTFYQARFPKLNYQVIPISHKGIVCKKHVRKDERKLHISYFGGRYVHKGYYQLKNVLMKMIQDSSDIWDISLYGSVYTDRYEDSRINIKGIFTKDEEEAVWDNTDLLVVPSQWPETFGFVVIEALARRIPVICSDLVGAGYLMDKLSNVCIYQYDNDEGLERCIKRFMNSEFYMQIQETIAELNIPVNVSEHALEIEKLYMRAREC